MREVIGQRLNHFLPACNEVLRIASVIGRGFLLEVLQRACGPRPGEAVLHGLDEALAAGLVEEVPPNRFQFAYALVPMTRYDELRTGERRRLHRAVGEAIETVHRHDVAAVMPELARHFQAAGDGSGRPVNYAMRVGARADAVLAIEDAEAFFQAALNLLQ
jgi:predicted ATPase